MLLDLWGTWSGPCIRQFPKLKELYFNYSREDLEIIGISTDQAINIPKWKNVIKNQQIIWKHFLDEDHLESAVLGINKFPTNFLLNREGIILEKGYLLRCIRKDFKF